MYSANFYFQSGFEALPQTVIYWMLQELEDVCAKWGLALLIISVLLFLLSVFTNALQEVITARYILTVLTLGGTLVITSFSLFRGSSSGLERRIHKAASAELSIVRERVIEEFT
jgi:hypothetical protein